MQIGVKLGRTDHGVKHLDPGGLPHELAAYTRLSWWDVALPDVWGVVSSLFILHGLPTLHSSNLDSLRLSHPSEQQCLW